jgi:hypothetical protein
VYDVVACDAAPGGVNNSWIPVVGNPLGTTAYTECPAGGTASRGMIARNIVAANSSASGNVGGAAVVEACEQDCVAGPFEIRVAA